MKVVIEVGIAVIVGMLLLAAVNTICLSPFTAYAVIATAVIATQVVQGE